MQRRDNNQNAPNLTAEPRAGTSLTSDAFLSCGEGAGEEGARRLLGGARGGGSCGPYGSQAVGQRCRKRRKVVDLAVAWLACRGRTCILLGVLRSRRQATFGALLFHAQLNSVVVGRGLRKRRALQHLPIQCKQPSTRNAIDSAATLLLVLRAGRGLVRKSYSGQILVQCTVLEAARLHSRRMCQLCMSRRVFATSLTLFSMYWAASEGKGKRSRSSTHFVQEKRGHTANTKRSRKISVGT
jgi:hypothetical protein